MACLIVEIIEKYVEGGYKPTGASYSESEKIKRKFFDVIARNLEDESFAQELNKRALSHFTKTDPVIYTNTQRRQDTGWSWNNGQTDENLTWLL